MCPLMAIAYAIDRLVQASGGYQMVYGETCRTDCKFYDHQGGGCKLVKED